MDPVCATSGGRHLRCACQLPVDVEGVLRLSALVQRRKRGRSVGGGHASRNQLDTRAFDVFDDAVTAGVVADVGEEVDVSAEPRKADGDIEWAAADVFADDLAVPLDDVDQRLADDQRALGAHVDSFRIKALQRRSRAVAVQ